MIERPTPGEQVAGIAGLALILTMFLFAWFGVDVPGVNGFDASTPSATGSTSSSSSPPSRGMALAVFGSGSERIAGLAQRGDDGPRRARRRSSC